MKACIAEQHTASGSAVRTTYRALQNNTRVATAVTLKNGEILQVWPKSCSFLTVEEWKATYPNAVFKEGTASPHPHTQFYRNNPVLGNLSLPLSSLTPFQNLVRHFVLLFGLFRDGRLSSQEFVLDIPSLSPKCRVSMRKADGEVIIRYEKKTLFGRELRTLTAPCDMPVEGVRGHIFFDSSPIEPLGQKPDPTKKTVVYCPKKHVWGKVNDNVTAVQTLLAAGYNVLLYNTPGMRFHTILNDTHREELYALPGVVAVFSCEIDPKQNRCPPGLHILYPSPDDVKKSKSLGRRLTLDEWIAERAAAAL